MVHLTTSASTYVHMTEAVLCSSARAPLSTSGTSTLSVWHQQLAAGTTSAREHWAETALHCSAGALERRESELSVQWNFTWKTREATASQRAANIERNQGLNDRFSVGIRTSPKVPQRLKKNLWFSRVSSQKLGICSYLSISWASLNNSWASTKHLLSKCSPMLNRNLLSSPKRIHMIQKTDFPSSFYPSSGKFRELEVHSAAFIAMV